MKVLITKPKKIDLTNYIAKPATENFKGDQVIVKDFSLNVPSKFGSDVPEVHTGIHI